MRNLSTPFKTRSHPGTVIISRLLILTSGFLALPAQADEETDLAMQLANPVASLISVPIQVNYDQNFGPNDDGSVVRTNIQPVIPFELNENWNLITRTIIPVIKQSDLPVKGMDKSGLGDITFSAFFAPSKPTSGGYIIGVGPALLLRTASDERLGSEKWAIGPTALILKQQNAWTYGMLLQHLESFAGDSSRDDVSSSLIQPFLSRVTETHTTFSISSEATYNHKNNDWTVPLNMNVSQLLKFGEQVVSLNVGPRYWLKSPDGAASGWGSRFQFTLLFPK